MGHVTYPLPKDKVQLLAPPTTKKEAPCLVRLFGFRMSLPFSFRCVTPALLSSDLKSFFEWGSGQEKDLQQISLAAFHVALALELMMQQIQYSWSQWLIEILLAALGSYRGIPVEALLNLEQDLVIICR